MAPAPSIVILAHGVGGRRDLPIPFSYVLVGGAAAVIVSFAAVLWLWPVSRLRGADAGRPLPEALAEILDSPATRTGLRTLGIVLAGFTAGAAVFGVDDELNPTAVFVYVVFWVGLIPASLLFGPVWRMLNPLRTIHRGLSTLLRRTPQDGFVPLPARLGYWPAAVSLLAFTALELAGGVNRDSTRVLMEWFGAYALIHLGAAVVFGAAWFDKGDGFEVFSSFAGRMSPWGRREDGRPVLRSPLNGLDTIEPAPGLVACVSVLFGSTAFDGASASTWWANHVQNSPFTPSQANALGLLATVTVVALTFTLALRIAARIGGADTRAAVPRLFAHSIVPIAVGYVIAHYFSLLVFNGQQALILASDPLGTGADLFGTGSWHIDYTLVSLKAISLVQVFGIVIGHVVATVSAHDRAVRLFPRRHAVLGQLPMLALMVGYTVGGLLLLFSA